jgi:hypothetical protein
VNLDQYTQSARVKALVYGPPKSGKTVLVGKLAEAGFTMHFLDLDHGIKSLMNPEMLKPVARKNIQVYSLPDHRMYPIAIDTVRAILKGGLRKFCHAHGKINCPLCSKVADAKWYEIDILKFTDKDVLVIDTLSQLSNSAMSKVTLKELQAPGGEEYKQTFNDYAKQGQYMEEVLSLIQVLDVNIICISHDIDSEKVESTKEYLVPIVGTRNFSKLAAKYFDEVVYVSIVNKKHSVMNTSTSAGNVLTGGRSGVKLDGLKDTEISLLPLFKQLGVNPS